MLARLTIDQSIYLIKPEAMDYRMEIRDMVFAAGLEITRTAITRIPLPILKSLYPELHFDLQTATEMFIGQADVEVNEVRGERAVERLLKLCGDSVDPSQCCQSTIRNRFGFAQSQLVGSAQYFRNAIHRPRTAAEAERDLRLLSILMDRPNIQVST